MGYGTVVISTQGQRDEKIGIIRKIYKRFSNKPFTTIALKKLLTSGEMELVNMNKWRYDNIVRRGEYDRSMGSPRRTWSLTQCAINEYVDKTMLVMV